MFVVVILFQRGGRFARNVRIAIERKRKEQRDHEQVTPAMAVRN